MSAHILLNFLHQLGKRDKLRGLPSGVNCCKTTIWRVPLFGAIGCINKNCQNMKS